MTMEHGCRSVLIVLLMCSILEAQTLTSRESFPVAVSGFVRVDEPDDAAYGILTAYHRGATKCHVYVYDPAEFGFRGTAEEILRAEADTLKSVLQAPEARAVYDRVEFKPDRPLVIDPSGRRLSGVLLTGVETARGQTFTCYTFLIAVDGLRLKVHVTGDDSTSDELVKFVEDLLQRVLAGKGLANGPLQPTSGGDAGS